MKAVISICIVILFFFGFAIWAQRSLVYTAQEMVRQIEAIEEAAHREDWRLASKEMELMQDRWTDTKKKWQMLIDHQEIDNIDSTLIRAKSWVDLEGRDDCISELATLKLFVLHIPEREALRITNIF